jgi:hypothetical protein
MPISLAERCDHHAWGPLWLKRWSEEPTVAVLSLFSIILTVFVVLILVSPRRDIAVRISLLPVPCIEIRASARRPVETQERHADVGGPDVADLDGIAGLDHLAVADDHGDMSLPHHQITG